MNAHAILLFAGLAGAAAAADLTLADFRAEVQFRDRRQSKVAATVRLKGETGGAIVRHTFLIYDGRQIEAVRAEEPNGVLLSCESKRAGRVLELACPARPAYQIFYSLETAEGQTRVPLPVPDVRTPSGKRVVEIRVKLPPGEVASRDTFPFFAWQTREQGVAHIANVPSFVSLAIHSAGIVSRWNQVATVSALSDAAIVAILVFASIMWRWQWGRRKG